MNLLGYQLAFLLSGQDCCLSLCNIVDFMGMRTVGCLYAVCNVMLCFEEVL